MIRAEKVRVSDNEGRYVLLVTDEDGIIHEVDIHDDVLDFYASVRAEIRPYVIESDHARATMPVNISGYQEDGEAEFGYAADDPKHPTYHERLSDAWSK
jgi:hypothetical protein